MSSSSSNNNAATSSSTTSATAAAAAILLLKESPPLQVSTLTHTAVLSLPVDYRIDLRELALALPIGGESPGDIVCARFSPPSGEAVERGQLGNLNRVGKKDFGNQLQLRMKTPAGLCVQVKVFATGALATTGAKSEGDAIFALNTFMQHLQDLEIAVKGRGPIELRNALCTGYVGVADALWDVDAIFEYVTKQNDPKMVPYRIKARGRAAILEVGSPSEDGGHAPRCIIHPSGSVQIMGKVVPAVATEVYEKVRLLLSKVLHEQPTALISTVGLKPKPKRRPKNNNNNNNNNNVSAAALDDMDVDFDIAVDTDVTGARHHHHNNNNSNNRSNNRSNNYSAAAVVVASASSATSSTATPSATKASRTYKRRNANAAAAAAAADGETTTTTTTTDSNNNNNSKTKGRRTPKSKIPHESFSIHDDVNNNSNSLPTVFSLASPSHTTSSVFGAATTTTSSSSSSSSSAAFVTPKATPSSSSSRYRNLKTPNSNSAAAASRRCQQELMRAINAQPLQSTCSSSSPDSPPTRPISRCQEFSLEELSNNKASTCLKNSYDQGCYDDAQILLSFAKACYQTPPTTKKRPTLASQSNNKSSYRPFETDEDMDDDDNDDDDNGSTCEQDDYLPVKRNNRISRMSARINNNSKVKPTTATDDDDDDDDDTMDSLSKRAKSDVKRYPLRQVQSQQTQPQRSSQRNKQKIESSLLGTENSLSVKAAGSL